MTTALLRTGAVAAALVVTLPARAQQSDEQLWLQLNAVVPLAADRLRLTVEQIERFSDRQDGLYQTEFGGLLGYRLNSHVELGFGYRRVGAHGGTGSDEDRIRQQVVVTAGRLAGRLRLDERFHPGGSEIGFRLRPLLRYNQPLGRGALAAFASHESFFLPNTTRWGQRGGYERMRNIAGLTLPVGRRVSADVGYLNQYRPARGGSRAQVDHALTVQLTISTGGRHAPAKVDD